MKFDFTSYIGLYTADFETSTDAWKVEKARVWLWDICDRNFNHKNGYDIDSFMKHILSISMKAVIGFRNLAYDGTYILIWLLENGYKFVGNTDRSVPKTFNAIITELGQHYAYEIITPNRVHIVIMDTLKYVNMSIKKSAEQYNLPIKKGDIDYDLYREIGYIPTDDEMGYIHNDTEIDMYTILLNMQEGAIKFTQAGNARNEFKKLFDTATWNNLFPQIEIDEDVYMRKAYSGGYVNYNEYYKDKVLTNMISLDINSMYPAQMLHRPMPFGYPIQFEGKYQQDKVYNIYIQKLKCCFTLKENGLPIISSKKGFVKCENLYVKSSNGKVWELTLANPDLELFFENYTVWDIEWCGGYKFQSVSGREITPEEASRMSVDEVIEADGKGSYFYDYIKKWRYIKEHAVSGSPARDYAKRMQNALYGALATNPKRKSSIPKLDDRGMLRYDVVQSGNDGSSIYLPASIFITAWSRYFLIKTITAHKDRFVYCDTDSLYIRATKLPKDLNTHKSLYGFFKVEHIITLFKVVGSKRYIYYGREPKDKLDRFYVTCCGADEAIKKQMNFNTFNSGAEFYGKKSVHNVLGGKHVCITSYKLGKKSG